MNGYRCVCLNGFAGVNCDKTVDLLIPSTSSLLSSTFFRPEVTSLYSSTPSDDRSPTPETEDSDGSNLRYLVLVICLGVVLTLLALCAAIVIVMLHRRHRLRSAAGPSCLTEKMNNADVRSGFQSAKAATSDDDESGCQQQQQQQQRYIDFTTKEQMQMQRNINHTKNLKNVEKCPSRKSNTFSSAWGDNNATSDPLSNSPNKPADVEKYLDKPESRTNNKMSETSTWKQRFAHQGRLLSFYHLFVSEV